MPEPTPSQDDPFADLFSKLPDPSARTAVHSGLRAASSGHRPEEPAARDGSTAADAAPNPTPAVPLSRRAAREAAAAATGATPVHGAPAHESAESAPIQPPVRAWATPVQPESAPEPPHEPDLDPDPEPAFDPEAPAPALPYARTGGIRLPDAAATPQPGGGVEGEQRRATHPVPTTSLDDLFAGRASTDAVGAPPPPPDKRKRRIGGWIALGIVLVLLGGVTAGGWYVWTTYESQIRAFMGWEEPKDYEDGLANGEVFVTIVSGDTGRTISTSLYEAGVTKTSSAFYDYLVDTAQNPPFVPGVFKLQKRMTSEAALAAIMDPANKQEHTAQLREGLTVADSLGILSESLGIPLADFEAAIADPAQFGVPVDPAIVAAGGQPLEGWLFPATYTFDPGVTAQQVVQTLVDRTVKSLDAASVPVDDRQRILTIASIIQREARFEDDFYKVSRVIQNRLDPGNQETFGLLQMDSTAQYGFGEMHDGTVSSSQEALDDPNPWNTYVHPGLPIGPIANPGDVAIDAAMHPADGDWLYFVTVNLETGETVFTSNLADHNRAVAQWQDWCKANPDSGC